MRYAYDGRTLLLEYDDVPPSWNTTIYGHWRKQKKVLDRWKGIFADLLLLSRLPHLVDGEHRRIVVTHAVLRFPQYRHRDEGNFRVPLEKALGDTLVSGNWLEDDTPAFYSFGPLTFADEPGPKRTRLTLAVEGQGARA